MMIMGLVSGNGKIYRLVVQLLTISLTLVIIEASPQPANWPNHGGDLQNRRYGSCETKISPSTVSGLTLKWKFEAGRDITATPAIYRGVLYFPSWDGFVYAVNAATGSLIWKQNLQQLTGIPSPGTVYNVNVTVARATPTIAEDLDLIIIGLYGPGVVCALTMNNGSLAWMTKLDPNIASVITMSGTYYKRNFYVGVSSLEELGSIETCCTFRGSFCKLNAKTGKIIWQTYMLPDNNGQLGEYAGAAVWGSSPPIDESRNHIYIATGNLYSAPKRVTECQERENNQTFPAQADTCLEPEDHSESFLALNLSNGEIEWYNHIGGYDVWFLACNDLSTPNCPPGPNPDADFGEAPMLLTVGMKNGGRKDIAVAVQKSGFAWALERDHGNIVWTTEAGPGSIIGGGIWGAATDEKTVYTNIANYGRLNFTLKPSNQNTTAGGWVAMNATTGNVLWTTANPSNSTATGPVSLANGVLFAGSSSSDGPVYAMNGKTGQILWSYVTGASAYGGISVSDGCIYFGHGYKVGVGALTPTNTPGKTLFAFCV